MMMTWCRTKGRLEAWKREGIFQQEVAWVTIKQQDTIVHPFIFGQFLHDAASCCIIQDGRSKKFHLGKLGHIEFWEQYVETVNHTREVSGSEAHIDYLGLPWVYFEAYPLQLSDTPMHIAEDQFRGAADRRVNVMPDVQFRLYSTGNLIYCMCKHERAGWITLLDT